MAIIQTPNSKILQFFQSTLATQRQGFDHDTNLHYKNLPFPHTHNIYILKILDCNYLKTIRF